MLHAARLRCFDTSGILKPWKSAKQGGIWYPRLEKVAWWPSMYHNTSVSDFTKLTPLDSTSSDLHWRPRFLRFSTTALYSLSFLVRSWVSEGVLALDISCIACLITSNALGPALCMVILPSPTVSSRRVTRIFKNFPNCTTTGARLRSGSARSNSVSLVLPTNTSVIYTYAQYTDTVHVLDL